jgi:hypothetical protein
MPALYLVDLSDFTPEAAKLSDIRGSKTLPFALYDLANLSITDIESLASILDKNNIIGTELNVIHLVYSAPGCRLQRKILLLQAL